MDLQKYNKIYCLGIGGIGVSAQARLFLAMGKEVAGADLKDSSITEDLKKNGISVFIGSNEEALGNLKQFKPDLVVYSNALPAAVRDQIKVDKFSQGEMVGKLMEGKYGIGVTGTNGKSTTTALLGVILEQANFDPTVLVGSQISSKNENEKFVSNARLGNSKYVVVESDEYARKMLLNRPQMIVITNIAEDHLDVYKDLTEIRKAFLEYVESLPAEGILVYNADDHNSIEVCRQAKCHKFTFGVNHYADLQAVNRKVESGRQKFDLHLNDEFIGSVSLKLPGEFNVSNALGAILAALKLGVNFEDIKAALENFAGLWRRFEIVGTIEGKPVISDYAHHPAGISATIKAAKEFYPGKKILVVFQPHHRNRTKALFGQFVESLEVSDGVIVPEIFDVAGREHGELISSEDLVNDLVKLGQQAEFAMDLNQAKDLVAQKISDYDVVLCMGAGDIDSMARDLVG